MADATRSVDLIFNGVDKTQAAVQSALKNTQKFAGGIQSATQPIADFTVGALKFEGALLSAGLVATAFSVKIAGDFDSAFREISTLIEAPVEDLDAFRTALLDYASTSTKPLEEVTQSIYNAISAGVDFSESIQAVSVAEKLSVAGKATLNESLVVLVSSLNAYGLKMDSAERFADALFTTVKQGQTTLPELGASLASVTGLAATTGVSFEELLAAIAALTSTGTPTAQAVTQIQGALSAILKPSSAAVATAKELGIEFNLQRLKAVGLSGVLADVQRATGGNAEEMAKLFGRVEALNGVLTLTGLGADEFADNLVAMLESAGAVDAAFEIMILSADLAAQKIQNSLKSLFIAIGSPLLDEFNGVAEAIAAIFNAFGANANTANLKSVIDFIEGEFGSLEATLRTVAENLPAALDGADFSGFIRGIKAVTGSIGGLFGDIDVTTVDGLADAITLAGKAFENLSEFSAGAIDSFKPLANLFFDIGEGAAEMSAESFRSTGKLFGLTTQLNLVSGAAVPVAASLFSINEALKIAGAVGGLTQAIGVVGGGGLLGSLTALGAAGLAAGIGATLGVLADKVVESTTGTSLITRILDDLAERGRITDAAAQIVDDLNKVQLKVSDLKEVTTDFSKTDLQFGIINDLGDLEEAAGDVQEAFSGLQEIQVDFSEFDKSFGIINELPPLFEETADAVEKLGKASEELDLEEKVALIESRTAITTAAIEADAQRAVAAFDSVSTAITSTGDTLSSLYGQLGNENISKLDKLGLKEVIADENKLRQQSFELQKKLLEAEIRSMNAKTKALNNGDALIKVSGDGLQPHLEAIMYDLFRAIQVKVNAEGYEMLLGV